MSGRRFNPFDAIREAIKDATNWIEERVKDIREDIKEMVKDIAESIEDIVKKVIEEYARVGKQIEDEVKKQLADLEDGIKDLGKAIDDIVIQNAVNAVKLIAETSANITQNLYQLTKDLKSAALEGDLKAIEDSFRESQKRLEDDAKESLKQLEDNAKEIGRDFDDAVHMAVDPVVDAVQYVRDEVVRPAWNEYRNALKELAKTVEDELIKPVIDNAISAIDELAANVAPEEFERLYLQAKNAINDAVDKVQESRDDVRESLKQIEEELKKAGKFVDDIKVEIIKMAAVIAVSFIPGAGPLAAIALQAALDEISGNESIFDRIAEGNIADIASVLTALAQALPVVGPSIGISNNVIAAVKNAETMLKIANQLILRKDEIEALIKGEFDNIEEALIKSAIGFASYQLSEMLPQDLGDILLKNDFLAIAATGNSEEIQNALIGNVVGKINGQFNNFKIPTDLVQKIVSGDAEDYLKEQLSIALSEKLSGALSQYLPKDLNDIISADNLAKILKGDLSGVEDSLKEKVSASLTKFINDQLPQIAKDIVGEDEIKALLNGDTEVLEKRLESYAKTQLNVYIEMINSDEIIQNVKEFRSEIENVIDEVKSLEDQLKNKYEEIKNSYVDEFKEIRDEFKSQIESKISEVKNVVKSQIEEAKNQVNLIKEAGQNLTQEVKSKIEDAANQLENLAKDSVEILTEQYQQNVENIKNTLDEIANNLEGQFKENISNIKAQLDLTIDSVKVGIKAAQDYADFVKDEANLSIAEAKARFEEVANNLQSEFKNQINKIKELEQKITNEAKANFSNFQDQIRSIERSILRNVSSYRDAFTNYQNIIAVAVKQYFDEQADQIENNIETIKTNFADQITTQQSQALTKISEAVAKIETIENKLSDEFIKTVKLIENAVAEIQETANGALNQQFQMIQESAFLIRNYYNETKLNIEFNAKLLLAEIIAPELKSYLSKIAEIFNQVGQSLEQKTQLLQALKEQNIAQIKELLIDLGIENSDTIAKYLKLVEDAFEIYSAINEKIKLADQLTEAGIDILSEEYQSLVNQLNSINLEEKITEFANYYKNIADADLDFLKDDISAFVEDVSASIDSVLLIAQDITQSHQEKVSQYFAYVEEVKIELRTSIQKEINSINETLSSEKNSAVENLNQFKSEISNNGTKLLDLFGSKIDLTIASINSFITKDYANLLNDDFLENLIKSNSFNIDETILAIVDDIKNQSSLAEIKNIQKSVENIQFEISAKIAEIDEFKSAVEANISQASAIITQLNNSTDVISQNYHNLLQNYKNLSKDLNEKLSNSATNLISEAILQSYQSFVLSSQNNVVEVKLKIENAVKNSIALGVKSTISGSLNQDYIKSIIDKKIGELTKTYFDQEIFITDQISKNLVSQTADWFKTSINTISGDGNNTTITGTSKNDYIIDNLGNDTINAGDGDDYVQGGVGDDVIYGGGGNDRAFGGDGNHDMIEGGRGADYIDGGEGSNDYSVYYSSSSGVDVNLATGIGKGGDAEGDILVNIESVDGSYHDDIITGSDKDNVLYGVEGDDIIYGKEGNDNLYGGLGFDRIYGGNGNDKIYSNIEIFNYETNTVWSGHGVGDTGVKEWVDLNGDGKMDYVTTSRYGQHYVSLSTGTGYINQVWSGHGVGDTGVKEWVDLNGDGKMDYVTTHNNGQHFVSISKQELDFSKNSLFGEDGDDSIYGGSGSDQINGGLGADNLMGGLGSDSFNYSSILDSTDSSRDLIQDFELGIDKINLSEINSEKEIISFDSLEVTFKNGQTIVKDLNSNFEIVLVGNINLGENDFEF